MSIWETMKSWWRDEAKHNIAIAIPIDRVHDEPPYDVAPIVADQCYVRVWVAEMFLKYDRDWFVNRQAAVQGLTRLKFADNEVELVRVAAPSRAEYTNSQAVLRNYALLELTPFRGGSLELEAGLIALKGADQLAAAIDVIAGFSNLLATPISSAIAVAKQVKVSADKLFSANGDVHLAYSNRFVDTPGENRLVPGYIAIVRAEDGGPLDKSRLTVRNGMLYVGSGEDAKRLEGYDYMLLRVERAGQRDDIEHFTELAPLRSAWINAAIEGDDAKIKASKLAFVARVLAHPELIATDCRRLIASASKDVELASGALQATATPSEWTDFTAALPESTDGSPTSFEEFFPELAATR